MKIERLIPCLGVSCVMLWTPAVAAQGIAWEESFDSYPTGPLVVCGLGVCCGPNNWTAWDDSAGAVGGVVTSAQAHTPGNSLALTNVDDMVAYFPPDGEPGEVFDVGVWKVSTWVYVSSAQTDNNYFIMLNQYDGSTVPEWSVQVEFDGATGKVRSAETGDEVDLITDAWALLEVIMNLNDDPLGDTVTILYNGIPVTTHQWSSANGTTTLQAIDLWGDSSTFTAYYDTMSIETLPELGACCVPDSVGTCLADADLATCAAADGVFQGFGTLCAASDCPILGADGYIVDAPLVWTDDSSRPTYQGFPCSDEFGFNSTVQWEVTIPWPETWKFTVCGAAAWDTRMGLGTTPCDIDLGYNDDFDCGAGVVQQSELNVPLAPGTYYLTLAGATGADSGPFTLTIDGPCALVDLPGAIPEGEADCFDNQPPDVYNSGCNDPAEAFLPIACGDAYVCTTGRFFFDSPICPPGDIDGDGDIDFQDLLALLASWSPAPGSCPGCPADVDGDSDVDFQDLLLVLANWEPDGCPGEPTSARDTDWWLFEPIATTEVTYTATGTFPLQMLLIELPGADVTEGCANLVIEAFALPGICETGTIVRSLDPGRYALWGGPQGGTDPITAPCGSEYNVTLTCAPAPAAAQRQLPPRGPWSLDERGTKAVDPGLAPRRATRAARTALAPPPTFEPPVVFAAAGEPNSAAVGDFDGDGDQDLAIVIPDPNPLLNGQVQVFENLGTTMGTWDGFAPPTSIVIGREPIGVTAGRLNNNPFVDIAVCNKGDDDVTVLLDPPFGPSDDYSVGAGSAPISIAAGVFTGPCPDVCPTPRDLAVGRSGDGFDDVVFLENDGAGGFMRSAPAAIPVGGDPCDMEPEDLDEDEDTDEDLVIANCDDQEGAIAWFQSTTPAPSAVVELPTEGVAVDVATGKFNPDEVDDVEVTTRHDVCVFVHDGEQGFVRFCTTVGSLLLSGTVGDFDGDLDDDIAVAAEHECWGSVVLVIENLTTGPDVALGLPVPYDVLDDPLVIIGADLDGDGLVDIITANRDNGAPNGGSVSVLLATP